jgi:GTP diphosphokinase / guanosine-3',5'-bis(diphosphate) 3'-diphosphatase
VAENADLRLVTQAANFAAHAHRAQKRKDHEATPYINHLTEVAFLLADAGCASHVVAAGYLHDTIEDVDVTYQDLAGEFGQEIADIVLAVTDDKTQAKQVRKDLQVEHAAHATRDQAAVKLADKISNLRSLQRTPPAGWQAERLAEYVHWAHRVVSSLPDKNPRLLQQYDAIREMLLPRSGD